MVPRPPADIASRRDRARPGGYPAEPAGRGKDSWYGVAVSASGLGAEDPPRDRSLEDSGVMESDDNSMSDTVR
jgi:hypothetical protein